MESLVSRSSHRRKHSTTAANIFSSAFSFKNPYGDVLLSNGAERNSPQVHEYSEIFSGSSSIPVLDLSGMDERVGSSDSRSSKLDYTNIFGGLTHDEVCVPYEELFKGGSAKKSKTRSVSLLSFIKKFFCFTLDVKFFSFMYIVLRLLARECCFIGFQIDCY